MAKAKKGDKLSCEVCELVVVVDEACGCASTAIVCCGKPMGKAKPAAKAGKKAAPVAAKPKAAPAKAAPKKAPAKKLPTSKK
jgi:RNA polymerase primary sigma factor